MSKERFPCLYRHGGLVPANRHVARILSERGYRDGETLLVTATKPLKPWYNRYAHLIGGLCVKQIRGFENLDHHSALKRLQWESGAHCEEMGAMVPGVGLVNIRIPKSLARERCSQEDYEAAVKVICRHITETYWPEMTPEQVQEMAETMPEEV